MALAAAIVFYIDIWNGHEPMPIIINLVKQLGMDYIMITLISRLFSLKNWERLMNIPTLIYLIIMVACFFIIAHEKPDVLQMQGIPSHGIYGVMLYFSILLIAISADFYAYHASSKKLVLA